MSTRIRLQRHGKKGKPFFHIVVADNRSKRDGRFIEKIGTYNPNTNPASIDLDFDRALTWVQNGAEPSDTARAILSYKGVLMKDHLVRGVKKGALTMEQAEAKFTQWLDAKTNRIGSKVTGLAQAKASAQEARLAAEKEKNEARAAALAASKAEPEAVEEAPEEVSEEATEEAPEEAVAAADVTEEAPAAESAEATESAEAPAEEEKSAE